MKLVIGSDLHHEFEGHKPMPPVPECDLLILAGDIDKGEIGLYWAGMVTADTQVPTIYVPGNHEYYGWNKTTLNNMYRDFKHDNVMILNPGVVEHGDFVIIGAPLYSQLTLPGYRYFPPSAFGRSISDFIVTTGWTVEDHIRANLEQVKYIEDMLKIYADKRCIVVTHFVPSMECISKFWEGNDLNPYFINNLDWLIDEYEPEAWIFGHTHDAYNFVHSNQVTKMLCNPRGYPKERGKARAFKWLTVEL